MLQVWAITYNRADFPDALYERALPLVDEPVRAKIQKYVRREDAVRSLIGNLLPRMLLKRRGVARDTMHFSVTETNKPYVAVPGIDPPLAYNVTHDASIVAMAFGAGDLQPPAFTIGIDVMCIKKDARKTLKEFVDEVDSQLTEKELEIILDPSISETEGLTRFYWIWTLKEAYVKSLGLGIGLFEIKRIEYNVPEERVLVDGKPANGWQFRKFKTQYLGESYVGVASKFIGGRATTIEEIDEGSLVVYDAAPFVDRAVEELV